MMKKPSCRPTTSSTFGPGAGVHGGKIVAEGTRLKRCKNEPKSLTGQYLSGKRSITDPARTHRARCRKTDNHRWRDRQQPEEHVEASIPVGLMTCVSRASPVRASRRSSTTPCIRRLRICSMAPASATRPRTTRFAVSNLGRPRHRHQPEPDRPHAALQPGDLQWLVHADSRAVRRHAGSALTRLHAGALQFQRQGWALRSLPGRWASSRSRCISCRTSTCLATFAAVKRYNRETLEVPLQGQKRFTKSST